MTPSAPPLRVVLDSNVWADWLVFDDPAVAPVRAAVAAGDAVVLTDPACEAELARLLARLPLKAPPDAACVAMRLAQHRACGLQAIDTARMLAACAEYPLARCRDRSDQKFLELAWAGRAGLLVTRDRELLAMARRRVRPLPFSVVSPRDAAAFVPGRQAQPSVRS